MMTIAPNSRASKEGKKKGGVEGGGSMEEFERIRGGILTTRELYNPVSNMLHHV